MRAVRLAVLSLIFAAALAAQPPSSRTTTGPVPTMRSVMFDVAALVDDRQRFGIEPAVFGRWTLGLVGTHTKTRNASPVYYRDGYIAVETDHYPIGDVCIGPRCYPGQQQNYNAWSLDFAVRHYPAALSFSNPQHRLMLYLGEFVGYHWRRYEEFVVYFGPQPLGDPRDQATPPCDSVAPICRPHPILPGPKEIVHRLRGFEPGGEIGVRLIPLAPVFIEVGGWFKLVTIDDPMQRLRPGDVDARLVVAIGVGW